MEECNSNRVKMMAEAAESSTAVKVLVVKVQHVLPTVISKHITNR